MPSARLFSKVSRDGRTMYYKYVELHQAAKCKKCGENKEAKALWLLTKVKDTGMDVYDLGSVQKIQARPLHVRLDLWAIHLKSPTAALADAVKRTGRSAMVCGGGEEPRAVVLEGLQGRGFQRQGSAQEVLALRQILASSWKALLGYAWDPEEGGLSEDQLRG